MRTVWVVAGVWAPLVGLGMALGLRGPAAPTCGVLAIFLLRLVLGYWVARTAFASRKRLPAVAWMALGGAATVVVLVPWYHVIAYQDAPTEEGLQALQDVAILAVLAAGWYSLLAVLLYRPVAQSSNEQTDYGAALAALWAASPHLVTNLARTGIMSHERWYSVYLVIERETRVLFGDCDWFRVPLRTYQGPGGWMQSCEGDCFRFGAYLAVAGLLPIGVALLNLLRVVGRRRWVRLVAAGRISGWGLVDEAVPTPAGLPVFTGDGLREVRVLARVPNPDDPLHKGAVAVAVVAASRANRRTKGPRASKGSIRGEFT